MASDFAYMLGVAAAGFAVTFFFRALPFMLFAGRDRSIPAWVEKLGSAVSPLIILALVAYSYSSLEWRTPWPYIAGAATVGVELFTRNSLAGILAGTALYMALLAGTGCSTQVASLKYDAANPLLRVTRNGILFGEKFVTPKEAVAILEKHDIPHDATIHIEVDPDYADRRSLWVFQHNYLNRAGYKRAIFVHKRSVEAVRK